MDQAISSTQGSDSDGGEFTPFTQSFLEEEEEEVQANDHGVGILAANFNWII